MKQRKNLLPALALGLAVGLGVAAAVLGDRLTAPVSGVAFGLAGAIVLHCVFYMVNMNRWTKKL